MSRVVKKGAPLHQGNPEPAASAQPFQEKLMQRVMEKQRATPAFQPVAPDTTAVATAPRPQAKPARGTFAEIGGRETPQLGQIDETDKARAIGEIRAMRNALAGYTRGGRVDDAADAAFTGFWEKALGIPIADKIGTTKAVSLYPKQYGAGGYAGYGAKLAATSKIPVPGLGKLATVTNTPWVRRLALGAARQAMTFGTAQLSEEAARQATGAKPFSPKELIKETSKGVGTGITVGAAGAAVAPILKTVGVTKEAGKVITLTRDNIAEINKVGANTEALKVIPNFNTIARKLWTNPDMAIKVTIPEKVIMTESYRPWVTKVFSALRLPIEPSRWTAEGKARVQTGAREWAEVPAKAGQVAPLEGVAPVLKQGEPLAAGGPAILPKEGYFTPVKKGMEAGAELQSAGLPSGRFYALDKPFESTIHDVSQAKRVPIPEVTNTFDPDGLLSVGNRAKHGRIHEEVVGELNRIPAGSNARDAYANALRKRGFDSYIRGVDGDPTNRELIVLAKPTPAGQQKIGLGVQPVVPERRAEKAPPTPEQIAKADREQATGLFGPGQGKTAGQMKIAGVPVRETKLPLDRRVELLRRAGHGKAAEELAKAEMMKSDLLTFVKENGGLKAHRTGGKIVEGEEFAAIPIALRGRTAPDEMADMMVRRGLLPQGSGENEMMAAIADELRGRGKFARDVEAYMEGGMEPTPIEEYAGAPPYEPRGAKVPPRPATGGGQAELIRRSQIAQGLSDRLNLPIRTGHFRKSVFGHQRAGIYKPKMGVARVVSPVDIEAISHESGHFLEETLKPDLKPYVAELKAIATPPGTPSEGFAEFLRMYITNPAEAEAKTPGTFAYWKTLMDANPEVNDALLQARADYDRWLKLPATSRVMASIVSGEGKPTKPLAQKLDDLYTNVFEDIHPIKSRVTEPLRKMGVRIAEENDPYDLAASIRGGAGKPVAFLEHRTFGHNDFAWDGEPLNEILGPIERKGALPEFDAYLKSQSTLDRVKLGLKGDVSASDAQTCIAELEATHPNFRNDANRIYAYQDRVMQYAVDGNVISAEAYAKMQGAHPHHVSFYRVYDAAKRAAYGKKGITDVAQPIKRARGSERETYSPLESVVKDTYIIHNAVARNDVIVAMDMLARAHPREVGRIFEEIPADMAKVAQVPVKEVIAQLKAAGADVSDVPENLIEEAINVFRPSAFKPEGQVVSGLFKGKPKYFNVSDKALYDAFAGLQAEETGMLIRLLSIPTEMLRLGATGANPEFLAVNPGRDALTGWVTSKGGMVPGFDTFRGLASALKKDDWYWKSMISGGFHSMVNSIDQNTAALGLKEIVRTPGGHTIHVVKHPIHALRALGEYSELPTRLAEYRACMGSANLGRRLLGAEQPIGTSIKSRMMFSGLAQRDVSVDFLRFGAKTRAVSKLIAFWNPGMQGTDLFRRRLIGNPIRTSVKAIIGVTIPSILLWLANKDDPRVQELPQWMKDTMWPIPTRKGIIGIRKPFMEGIVYGTVVERMLDAMYEDDPSILLTLRQSFGSALPGWIASGYETPLELVANYDFFRNRPIVPASLEGLPPEQQYQLYTPALAKLIGARLGVSPLKVEHFIRGYTGGGGIMALDVADKILSTVKPAEYEQEERGAVDIPILRKFILWEPTGLNSESARKFYDLHQKANEGATAVKHAIREGNQQKAEQMKAKYPEYNNAIALNQTAKLIAQLRATRVRIWQNKGIPTAEKVRRTEIIDTAILKAAQDALKEAEAHR